MKGIVVLNGYKMMLPHYGKLNGMWGYFTTEGFVYVASDDGEMDLK